MLKIRNMLILVSLLSLLVLFTACGGSEEPTTITESEVIATDASPEVEEQETVPIKTDATDLGRYGQPLDVPIIDGAVDVQVSRTGENISYKAEARTLQEVYDYNRTQLNAYNWIPGPNEVETVISNQIALARVNDVGDRITISMQNNPIGEFVIVSIYVTRAP